MRSHMAVVCKSNDLHGAPCGVVFLTTASLPFCRVYIPAIYAVNKIDQITLVRPNSPHML